VSSGLLSDWLGCAQTKLQAEICRYRFSAMREQLFI
jgi:hypothetical protein